MPHDPPRDSPRTRGRGSANASTSGPSTERSRPKDRDILSTRSGSGRSTTTATTTTTVRPGAVSSRSRSRPRSALTMSSASGKGKITSYRGPDTYVAISTSQGHPHSRSRATGSSSGSHSYHHSQRSAGGAGGSRRHEERELGELDRVVDGRKWEGDAVSYGSGTPTLPPLGTGTGTGNRSRTHLVLERDDKGRRSPRAAASKGKGKAIATTTHGSSARAPIPIVGNAGRYLPATAAGGSGATARYPHRESLETGYGSAQDRSGTRKVSFAKSSEPREDYVIIANAHETVVQRRDAIDYTPEELLRTDPFACKLPSGWGGKRWRRPCYCTDGTRPSGCDGDFLGLDLTDPNLYDKVSVRPISAADAASASAGSSYWIAKATRDHPAVLRAEREGKVEDRTGRPLPDLIYRYETVQDSNRAIVREWEDNVVRNLRVEGDWQSRMLASLQSSMDQVRADRKEADAKLTSGVLGLEVVGLHSASSAHAQQHGLTNGNGHASVSGTASASASTAGARTATQVALEKIRREVDLLSLDGGNGGTGIGIGNGKSGSTASAGTIGTNETGTGRSALFDMLDTVKRDLEDIKGATDHDRSMLGMAYKRINEFVNAAATCASTSDSNANYSNSRAALASAVDEAIAANVKETRAVRASYGDFMDASRRVQGMGDRLDKAQDLVGHLRRQNETFKDLERELRDEMSALDNSHSRARGKG